MSLLELAVVLVIISVLLWMIGTRFFTLQVYAEQLATQQVVSALQSGLGMKVASHAMKGEWKQIEALEASNPMDNLAQVPKTYRGVLRNPGPSAIEAGDWYFDGGQRVLVYRVRNAEWVEGGARDPVRLRWSVRLEYEDRNGNQRFDSGLEQILGVRLDAVETFRWKR